jgi:ABC-2 type transport system permease protein
VSEAAARIRERGYRRYEGARTGTGGRFWVVARQLLSAARRQRAVTVLVVLAAFPTVISGFVVYFTGRLKPVSGDSYIYGLLLKPYGTFFLALGLAMRGGGGAIADEARAGAFQFYFARPLAHGQYLLGKLAGVAALVATVTVAPPVLLALALLALSAGGSTAHVLSLLLRGAVLGLIEAAVLACVVVALSSLMKRRGLVQGAFAAALLLPWLIGARFSEFTRTRWPLLASLPTHLDALGRWLFAVENDLGDRAMPPGMALLMLALVTIASVWLARRQLRRAEVVAG